MIGEPRLFGTDHDTVASSPAAPTDTDDTASATPTGTAATDNPDTTEEPEAFEAFTLNRYDVPFTKPVTRHEVELVVQVNPPGFDVTVYPLIAAPPSDTGATQVTTDWPFPPLVADTPLGAPGTAEGTTTFDGADSDCAPPVFTATTVNEYDVPFVKPVTLQDKTRVDEHDKPPGTDITTY